MLKADLLRDRVVLVRLDLDVPIKDGQVENDYRLQKAVPTLKKCLEEAKKVLVIGHLGRPEKNDPEFSLEPVRERLGSLLNQSFLMIDSLQGVGKWLKSDSRLGILENLRFNSGELDLDAGFVQTLTKGFDLYIYDAFAAYNKAASLNLIPKVLPTFTGLQFDAEIEALERIRKAQDRPAVLILSGAKDDKAKFIEPLAEYFDQVLIGGRLASLWKTLEKGEKGLPAGRQEVVATLTSDGLDISLDSTKLFQEAIQSAKTVVFNGPVGKFEDGTHSMATTALLTTLKDSPAFSLLGGGDTLAAISQLGFQYSDFDFVSTGGGAMLEYLATGTHPLLEIIS